MALSLADPPIFCQGLFSDFPAGSTRKLLLLTASNTAAISSKTKIEPTAKPKKKSQPIIGPRRWRTDSSQQHRQQNNRRYPHDNPNRSHHHRRTRTTLRANQRVMPRRQISADHHSPRLKFTGIASLIPLIIPPRRGIVKHDFLNCAQPRATSTATDQSQRELTARFVDGKLLGLKFFGAGGRQGMWVYGTRRGQARRPSGKKNALSVGAGAPSPDERRPAPPTESM